MFLEFVIISSGLLFSAFFIIASSLNLKNLKNKLSFILEMSNKVQKVRKVPAITKKIVLGIVLVVVALCALIFSASYYAFNRQFRQQYDSTVLDVLLHEKSLIRMILKII